MINHFELLNIAKEYEHWCNNRTALYELIVGRFERRLEQNLLMSIYDQGIVQKLVGKDILPKIELEELAYEITVNWGITEENAKDAIICWAKAFDVLIDEGDNIVFDFLGDNSKDDDVLIMDEDVLIMEEDDTSVRYQNENEKVHVRILDNIDSISICPCCQSALKRIYVSDTNSGVHVDGLTCTTCNNNFFNENDVISNLDLFDVERIDTEKEIEGGIISKKYPTSCICGNTKLIEIHKSWNTVGIRCLKCQRTYREVDFSKQMKYTNVYSEDRNSLIVSNLEFNDTFSDEDINYRKLRYITIGNMDIPIAIQRPNGSRENRRLKEVYYSNDEYLKNIILNNYMFDEAVFDRIRQLYLEIMGKNAIITEGDSVLRRVMDFSRVKSTVIAGGLYGNDYVGRKIGDIIYEGKNKYEIIAVKASTLDAYLKNLTY